MLNYKKILKSRALRLQILNFFSFIPDKLMIMIQYRIKTGNKLNLEHPKRYTEKLQWYKLFYRDTLMSICVDKYEVRQYVASCGFNDNLIPLIGIYDNVDEVDFSKLPVKFVAKDTLGGGGNAVIICTDKSRIDEKKFKQELDSWGNIKSKHCGREWVYDGRAHRIIIEEYIDSMLEKGGLIDYKFFCFNGRVEYLYVIADRKLGDHAGLGIFDRNFSLLPYKRVDEAPLSREINRPKNFQEMIYMAEKLAAPFPHVRVDLSDIKDNTEIRFGELTYFDGSGYMKFEPDEFDFMMGEKFVLPIKYKNS